MKIIADTATLLTPEQGAAQGITVIPVSVAFGSETYKDYVEISSEAFLQRVAEGGVPTSSQPSVGDMLEVYEACNEEAIFLTVGDGLSGAYQTAVGARACLEDSQRIHVIDSKTLAGPLRHFALKAAELRRGGASLEEIKAALQQGIESSLSFVIPADFEFLKRSGRLTTVAARVGGVLKLLPILTQTEDKKRIRPVTVKRSWRSAVEAVLQQLRAKGVGEDHLISVCHAGVLQRAQEALAQVQAFFPNTQTEILELSPALMTHGGPGCIVIQSVLK